MIIRIVSGPISAFQGLFLEAEAAPVRARLHAARFPKALGNHSCTVNPFSLFLSIVKGSRPPLPKCLPIKNCLPGNGMTLCCLDGQASSVSHDPSSLYPMKTAASDMRQPERRIATLSCVSKVTPALRTYPIRLQRVMSPLPATLCQ